MAYLMGIKSVLFKYYVPTHNIVLSSELQQLIQRLCTRLELTNIFES